MSVQIVIPAKAGISCRKRTAGHLDAPAFAGATDFAA